MSLEAFQIWSIDVTPGLIDPGWCSGVRVRDEEKVQSFLQAKVEMELLYGWSRSYWTGPTSCTRRPAQHSDECFEYGWQREGFVGGWLIRCAVQ